MGFSLYDIRTLSIDDEELDDTYVPNVLVTFATAYGDVLGLMSVLVRNSDTIDHVIDLHILATGAIDMGTFVSVTVPAGAGAGLVAPFDLLAAIPTTPAGLLLADPPFSFAASLPVAVSAGEMVHIHTVRGTF